MNKKTRLWKASITVYLVALVSFFLFFAYMILFENVKTETTRTPAAKKEITEYSVETVEDASAPVGVKTVYRFRMDDDIEECSILTFYTVHHYADVYYGDELVYSLSAEDDNRIGESVSSNWVIVPIHREDIGKEVTVVVTPLFESMVGYRVRFQLGSYFSSIYNRLKEDLPQLFISFLCIFLGLVIICAYIYFAFRMKTINWDIFFLGSFSLVLGMWRITDAQSSALLFSENPMALGYITIGSLFLCCTPLLLLMCTLFSRKKQSVLLLISIVITLTSITVLILQLFGIAEFKQMLSVSHFMMVIAAGTVLIMSMFSKKSDASSAAQKTSRYFYIVAIGIIIDLLSYYITKSSSDVIFTIIAFVVYTLIVFMINIISTTQKAFIDTQTGLYNKNRWNEIIASNASKAAAAGFIIVDINALKWVNDNFGHEAGDRLIFHFANILRNVFPSSCTISHWGGDEFAVMTLNMKKDKIEFYLKALEEQVSKHNDATSDPPIRYSAGYALSLDHPNFDTSALINLADKRMYENKNKWYEENQEMNRVRREY